MNYAENEGEPFTILLADDDAGDRMLAMEAFEEARVLNPVRYVEDGEELLQYLRALEPGLPLPGLILLDLNMPRKDGREALAEIKADPGLRSIPVLIMTTSRSPEDAAQMREMGASDFVSKPVTFEGLVDVMKSLSRYGAQFAAG